MPRFQPGDRVILITAPVSLLRGLPEEDQDAIRSIVGRSVVFAGFSYGQTFAYSANWYNDQEAERLSNGARRPLTGTPVQIADDIKRYAEVGVRHMMFPMIIRRPGVTVQQSLERMERFATEVMPFV